MYVYSYTTVLLLGLDTRRQSVEARRHPGYLRLADRMTGREQLDSRLVERRDLEVP
jgi:hypothetical protein